MVNQSVYAIREQRNKKIAEIVEENLHVSCNESCIFDERFDNALNELRDFEVNNFIISRNTHSFDVPLKC